MNRRQIYRDRREAGLVLAEHLKHAPVGHDPIVLALPRGGVPVAAEVAGALHAPLDVFLVRKLGLPGHEELAMGAIASGGVRVLHDEVIAEAGVSAAAVAQATEREARELRRREDHYRAGRPAPRLVDAVVIVVDDGLATGFSMRAAIRALRQLRVARLTVAVPVGAPESCAVIADEADLLVCPRQPEMFRAVGQWYERFDQVSDAEVMEGLRSAAEPPTASAGRSTFR